jgi:hypothetical protein
MKLVALLLADAVNETPDGRLNLLGAGLTHINALKFPATGTLTVVTRFEIASSEWIGSNHRLALRVMDEDGKDLLPNGRLEVNFDLPSARRRMDQESYFNQVLRLDGFSIPRFGRYRVVVLMDGLEVGSAPLTASIVKQAEPMAPPPPPAPEDGGPERDEPENLEPGDLDR